LEGLLLSNAIDSLASRDSEVSMTLFRKTWVIALILIVTGLLLHIWLERWIDSLRPIVASISEAFIVAGILALAVDSALKRDLVKEASKGIYGYLIGFDQEPQLKEKLKEIALETKIYRRDFRMKVHIEPVSKTETTLHLAIDYKVRNASMWPVYYQHTMSCDEFEHPVFRSMSIRSAQDLNISRRAGQIQINSGKKKQEAGVKYSCLRKVKLRPNIEYQCTTECSVTFPRNHFFVMNTSYPTIGFVLEIVAPPDCQLFPTESETHTGNIWEYAQLFMQHEHIAVRWKFNSPPSEDLPVSILDS
jgi:hypothetical protein